MATFHDIQTSDDERDSWEGDRLPPGVFATLLGLVGFLCVIGAPYLIASLSDADEAPALVSPADDSETGHVVYEPLTIADYRAWVEGDPIPFSQGFRAFPLWDFDPESKPGTDQEPSASDIVAVAPISIAPKVETVSAAVVPDVVEASTAAPDVVVEPPAPVDPISRIVVPPADFEGVEVEIEDPHGTMRPFYQALARTALGDAGAITRIAQWGDSAIAADGMTSTTRRLLQLVFGDAGHGFSLIASGNKWYKRKDIIFESSGWRAQQFIRKQAADGRYGFGGVAVVGYQGARASWQTVIDGPVGRTASRFEVHYVTAKRGGRLAVNVDGKQVRVIDTRADTIGDKHVTIEVDDAAHRFEIKNIGGGATRLYGVVIERGDQGVVLDSLGIIGARASRQLNVDAAHFASQLETRAPKLRVLMYGGNALPDSTPLNVYGETFSEVLGRFKGTRANEASCLVVSPLDHGERFRRRIRTTPRLYKLIEKQRQAALESGCAWFSLFDAMGGEGTMGRWLQSEPRLAASDLAHPTAQGAKVLGNLFFKALMKGFSDFVDSKKPASP